MTKTTLGIYNAALTAARARGRLSSLTEDSVEREECELWYELVRDQVQEGAFWDSCRRTARLTLLNERDFNVDWQRGDPETQFRYSYGLPSNYLRAWFLVNYDYFTLSFSESDNRLVLNTNVKEAVLLYAAVQDNPAHWSPSQRAATIYALAGFISGKLSGNNGLEARNFNLANQILIEAQVNNANKQGFQAETIPPVLQGRGYEDVQTTRYYYPYGSLFAQAVPNV